MNGQLQFVTEIAAQAVLIVAAELRQPLRRHDTVTGIEAQNYDM